jgi:hypothetical protein
MDASVPKTAAAVNTDRQRLARKLICDLVAFTGVAAAQLAAAPGKAPRRQRIFYRKPTHHALVAAVLEIGIDRWLAAADRVTQPRCDATRDLFAVAAEHQGGRA